VVDYAGQLLSGLCYLHEAGVIHRDIKGANVLVDDVSSAQDELKIADFGSARRLEQSNCTREDEFQSLHGTVFWMAPEVIRGASYGRKADIWSAGCVVVEMLQGRPPWYSPADEGGANIYHTMYKIVEASAPPPIDAAVDPALRNVLLRCLARDVSERPSARQLLSEEHMLFRGHQL